MIGCLTVFAFLIFLFSIYLFIITFQYHFIYSRREKK